MTTVAELVKKQDELQSEVAEVNADLDLETLLTAVGSPVRVGSVALGLMVRRDLDVTTICPELDATTQRAIIEIGAGLATHQRVRRVEFRNDTGGWNTDPSYPDGHYLGVAYRSPQGYDWSLDLWFVDEPDRQPDLALLRTLPSRLAPATRTAILRIKHASIERGDYGTSVRGYDVYRSVLDHGVRTPEQFDQWREDAKR